MSAVFGGMATLVAMLVVASMLGLSILLRQRELALLRAIGATPRQVRRMILAETAIVSVVAIILGAVVGARLGRWLFDRVAERGLVSHALVYRQGWIPIAAGAGTALIAALCVAAVSGQRAARTRPGEALAESELQSRWVTPGRLVLALLFIGGGLALALVTATVMTGPVAASTAAPTVILFAIGLGLLGPGVARVAIGVLRWPFAAVPGVATYLAVANARVRRIRMAAVIVPIMLATGVATAELYLQTTQTSATERGYTEKLRADLVLTPSTSGFSPTDVDTVRDVPGVADASAFASSTGYVEVPHDPSQGEDGWPLQGISTEGARETLGGVVLLAGSLDDLRGDTVALSVDHARDLDRGPGDMIAMRFGDGALVDRRIVALFSARHGFDTTLTPFSLAVSDTLVPSGPVWIYVAVVGIAFALTLPSTLVPAWLITRSAAVAGAK